MSEKNVSDSAPRKPEWFELTDNEAPSAQVRKINKVIPSLALLIASAVIGIGSLFATSADSNSQLSASTSRVSDSSITTAIDVAPSSDAITGGSSLAPSNGAIVSEPAGIGVPPPRGGGDDDDDEDEDEDDEDEDEDDD